MSAGCTKIRLTPDTVIECHRCGKSSTLADGAADNWNIEARRGVCVGFLCPECQTDEESIEAEVNAATIEYGTNGGGLLTGRPKAR